MTSSQRPEWPILLFILALTLWRIWTVSAINLPLFFDEAYYLVWAQNPDWGYFSKPPVVAWLIAITTGLFGQSETAVKLSAPLLYAGTSICIWYLARRLHSRHAADWASALFISMPLIGFNSLFMTTDAPLLFFWALTALLFLRAMELNSSSSWVLAGFAGGLGMLSKYIMILLPGSLLLFLLFSANDRKRLTESGFWLAVLTAFLVFSPNIIWNAAHDFISFQHTAEISQLDRQLFHPDRFLEFIFGQVLVVGPIAAILGLIAFFKKSVRQQRASQFSLYMALPIWISLALLALLARANLNWAGPATIGFAIFTAIAWQQLSQKKHAMIVAIAFNLLLTAGFYHYQAIATWLDITLTAKNDPYHRVSGWRELGQKASEILAQYPKAQLAGDNRKVLANLGYYTEPNNLDAVYWNPTGVINHHYALAADLAKSRSDSFIFFSENPPIEAFKQSFDQVILLEPVYSQPYPDLERHLEVVYLEGFQAYP